jgi:hypothetical protein
MKKIVVFLVVVVISISQLAAQRTTPASVAKLVYPGVVFGANVNSGSCYNVSPQSATVSFDSGFMYCVADKSFYSFGFREKFMIQYFRMRNRLLDHLLA